ncbi:MAG: hypothetical protein V4641_17035 [Pseudomonadota bacterium]
MRNIRAFQVATPQFPLADRSKATSSPAKARIKIYALWRHQLMDARKLAIEYMKGGGEARMDRVVFAQLINATRLSSAEQRALGKDGISVVPVAACYAEAADNDGQLREAVLEGLADEKRLLKLLQDTPAQSPAQPVTAPVDNAYKKAPKVASAQRREFLDEFYGAGEEDDGVR